MSDKYFTDQKNIDSPNKPTWCPGCGNHSIWMSLKQALVKLQIPQEEVVICYDIGCSGNMADFNLTYGFHGLHGRAIPPAVGIKLANHQLKVIVVIGDGGGYGEGLTHFLNEMRGNHDISIFVHDNHRYSLTTGQMSPTTAKGTATKSTPYGSIEQELNPLALAISNHATFVAREFAIDTPHLIETMMAAINHPGYAVVDILQPCLVFNPTMDANWYRQHIVRLTDSQYQPNNKENAWKEAMRQDKLPVGVFWQDVNSVPYHQEDAILKTGPLVKHASDHIDLSPILQNYK